MSSRCTHTHRCWLCRPCLEDVWLRSTSAEYVATAWLAILLFCEIRVCPTLVEVESSTGTISGPIRRSRRTERIRGTLERDPKRALRRLLGLRTECSWLGKRVRKRSGRWGVRGAKDRDWCDRGGGERTEGRRCRGGLRCRWLGAQPI